MSQSLLLHQQVSSLPKTSTSLTCKCSIIISQRKSWRKPRRRQRTNSEKNVTNSRPAQRRLLLKPRMKSRTNKVYLTRLRKPSRWPRRQLRKLSKRLKRLVKTLMMPQRKRIVKPQNLSKRQKKRSRSTGTGSLKN